MSTTWVDRWRHEWMICFIHSCRRHEWIENPHPGEIWKVPLFFLAKKISHTMGKFEKFHFFFVAKIFGHPVEIWKVVHFFFLQKNFTRIRFLKNPRLQILCVRLVSKFFVWRVWTHHKIWGQSIRFEIPKI